MIGMPAETAAKSAVKALTTVMMIPASFIAAIAATIPPIIAEILSPFLMI